MATTSEEIKKTNIAVRTVLNADGNEADSYTDGVKAVYSLKAFPDQKFVWDLDAPTPIGRAFQAEGFLNKMGHAANKRSGDKETRNKAAAMQEALGLVSEQYEAFKAGQWPERIGGPNDGAIIEAFAQIKGRTIEEQTEMWGSYSDENKSRIRTNKDVQQKVLEIKLERMRERGAGEATNIDDL